MPVEVDATVRSPFRHLCAQHIDEIGHLWSMWHTALHLPHYDRPALAELEGRVQAHIAGARVHGEQAWQICAATLDIADAGEVFAAAQIAFRSYEPERIRLVVDAVEANPHLEPGLVSALAWLPGDIAHPWVKKFLGSKQLLHKTMALAVCRLRGEDPAAYLARLLQRDDCLNDPALCDIALRCAGEFKRQDLAPLIMSQIEGQGTPPFAALYAATLMGHKNLAEQLKPFVFAGPCQADAIELALRVLPNATARQWISEMVEQNLDHRWTIAAAQALGDPQAIPWLIGLMREPTYARLAGQAFYTITGLDLQENHLAVADPLSLEQKIEQELADQSADMPIDEHLQWPDVDKIWRLWRDDLSRRYPPGGRYLLGTPPSDTALRATFAHGFQPQRYAAALELALLHEAMPLANAFTCTAPER